MCLTMMWKILTALIREETNYSFECHGLLLEEQKGCRRVYTETHLKRKQSERENVALACIDYKKADDMVSQTWIMVFENVQNIRQNHRLHE